VRRHPGSEHAGVLAVAAGTPSSGCQAWVLGGPLPMPRRAALGGPYLRLPLLHEPSCALGTPTLRPLRPAAD
jgi:hypothetical protein